MRTGVRNGENAGDVCLGQSEQSIVSLTNRSPRYRFGIEVILEVVADGYPGIDE